VPSKTGSNGDQDPREPNDENDAERFLSRFASKEARQVIQITKWFVAVAIAAVGIEILVTYLEHFPKLYFVTIVLDLLGKLLLSCDAILIAVFVVVATILTLHSVLKLIHIDLVALAKWLGRKIAKRFTRKRGSGASGSVIPPAIGSDAKLVIDHEPQQPTPPEVNPGPPAQPKVSKPPEDGASAGE
jgi:hypothetical protein